MVTEAVWLRRPSGYGGHLVTVLELVWLPRPSRCRGRLVTKMEVAALASPGGDASAYDGRMMLAVVISQPGWYLCCLFTYYSFATYKVMVQVPAQIHTKL